MNIHKTLGIMAILLLLLALPLQIEAFASPEPPAPSASDAGEQASADVEAAPVDQAPSTTETISPTQLIDYIPPWGDFIEPAANANVTPPVWIRVQAQDNPYGSGVAKVVFTHNGYGPWITIAADTASPYEVQWNMALVPDNHTFLIGAMIYDWEGNRTDIVRSITKGYGGTPNPNDFIPPTGDFTEPAPEANVSAPVWLRVQAQDNYGGSGVGRVVFTTNAMGYWTTIGEDWGAPYELYWNMAGVPDNHRFMIGAMIYDNAGNRTDRVRWITKGYGGTPNPNDFIPPTGDFTEPAPEANVSAPVWLRVQAQDNYGGSGVGRVVFTTNAMGYWTTIGEDWGAPYELYWNMAGVPDNHRFMIGAMIYDNAGNRTDRVRWITKGYGGTPNPNDFIPPTGDFTEPAPEANVSAPVWLRVQAQDNYGGSGVGRVVFTTNAMGYWTTIGED